MRCAIVFYYVATIFVIEYSLSELCVIRDTYKGKAAYCGNQSVNYKLDFIPPISHNISYIDLHGQPLKQLPYNGFRNLSSQSTISDIWLESCQISHVDSGALLNLHNLTTIVLAFNEITQIDSKLFSHTKQIKTIYLQYNNIEVLPRGLFENLTELIVVRLHNNRIRQVEWFSFKNTPSLSSISLGNNQIESMNMLFKDKFDNLTYLSVHSNPWKCYCELGPLYELLIKIDHLNQHGLVCEKPSILHGRQWSNISRDEFVCSSEDAISTTEQNENILVTVYNGTRYQQVDTGIPQSPSILSWILYTIFALALMCLAVLIIGVVCVVRHTLLKSNKRRHVLLPTILKRRSFRRTNASQMDTSIPMCVIQTSAVSEDSVSVSNTSDGYEEQTSIHHYAICEATIN